MPQAFSANLKLEEWLENRFALVNHWVFKLGDIRAFLFLLRGQKGPIYKGFLRFAMSLSLVEVGRGGGDFDGKYPKTTLAE